MPPFRAFGEGRMVEHSGQSVLELSLTSYGSGTADLAIDRQHRHIAQLSDGRIFVEHGMVSLQ